MATFRERIAKEHHRKERVLRAKRIEEKLALPSKKKAGDDDDAEEADLVRELKKRSRMVAEEEEEDDEEAAYLRGYQEETQKNQVKVGGGYR